MIYLGLAIFFPIVMGIILLLLKEIKNRKTLCSVMGAVLFLEFIFSFLAFVITRNCSYTLFHLTKLFTIEFKVDNISLVFAALIVIAMTLAGIFSFEYMKHESNEKRFYAFYLMSYGVLVALAAAGNLVTYYAFFELLTAASFALVMHTETREAIMAGLKYLMYSFCGAYLVVFGFYFTAKYSETLSFTDGGVFTEAALSTNRTMLLISVFCMIVGFSVKAGMFPLHAWLPTAHPVAPAPASAVLSGVIAKAGVLGVIRTVFYIFGADFVRGTWVQTAWITLTLITVFMGSMLAYTEDVMKKRFAYSTVSQISYILFGLAMLNSTSFTGSLIHVLAHGFIKVMLFLIAGAIIYKTGKTKVSELRGIGKEMPVTIWCFIIAALGLIGIPPTGGFISKWYLATGSLSSGVPVFDVLGPVVLLVSALLTAGYLLPIAINGFFPGDDFDYSKLESKEPSKLMTVPLVIMAALIVIIGVFVNVVV